MLISNKSNAVVVSEEWKCEIILIVAKYSQVYSLKIFEVPNSVMYYK